MIAYTPYASHIHHNENHQKSIGVQFDKPQITTFMSILTSDHLFLLQYIQYKFP